MQHPPTQVQMISTLNTTNNFPHKFFKFDRQSFFHVQVLIGTDSITNLHKLEQVSSDEGIGTLAENLLEALREDRDVNLKIEAARRETRAEKKRMAMAMRQKALGTLGMTVFDISLF